MQKTMHKIKECPFEEHSFNVSEGKLLIEISPVLRNLITVIFYY